MTKTATAAKIKPAPQFPIEADVPMPKVRSLCEVSYPFDELKPGGSFFVPHTVRVFGVVKRACIKWNQSHKNAHLVYRDDIKNKGTRIWKKTV